MAMTPRGGGGTIHRRIVGWVLVLALPLALPARPAPAQVAAPGAASDALLQPGDMLRINVWRNPDVSGELEVGADGALVHPFYRGVRLAGLPGAEVERRLTETLRRIQTEPQFAMQPLVRVTVTGEVRQPGLSRQPVSVTIADVLALAGGTTERARAGDIRLVRGGQETRLDLTEPGGPAARTPIRSGDLIVVPRRGSSFFERMTPIFGLLAAAASIATLVRN